MHTRLIVHRILRLDADKVRHPKRRLGLSHTPDSIQRPAHALQRSRSIRQTPAVVLERMCLLQLELPRAVLVGDGFENGTTRQVEDVGDDGYYCFGDRAGEYGAVVGCWVSVWDAAGLDGAEAGVDGEEVSSDVLLVKCAVRA